MARTSVFRPAPGPSQGRPWRPRLRMAYCCPLRPHAI